MPEWLPLVMLLAVFAILLAGYSVAATLAGVALIFAFLGIAFGVFDPQIFGFIPSRLFGIVTNQTLIAVPLFVFMGVTLEKTKIADTLLSNMSVLMGRIPGGLALAVIFVGTLLAASTGIVGATVITMGLLSLPVMLRQGYQHGLASGTIVATGTLGQIIPPSIALVLLADVLSNAYQQAQLSMGLFAPKSISVSDLFTGSLLPGMILVGLYAIYVFARSLHKPQLAPPADTSADDLDLTELLKGLLPPLMLIVAVLGSILFGIATPTEAAGIGATGALVLAVLYKSLNLERLRDIAESTMNTTCMVFFILIGASVFSLVFRGFGGDEMVQNWFNLIPGGVAGAIAIVMLIIFLLGFILDFIEITYVVVPIVGPILLAMGIDPVWLGVLIAVNLQTSFLTPPFGFALFYLRGIAPPELQTQELYRGVIPFVALQLLLIGMLVVFPQLATWLPEVLTS